MILKEGMDQLSSLHSFTKIVHIQRQLITLIRPAIGVSGLPFLFATFMALVYPIYDFSVPHTRFRCTLYMI